MKLTLFLIAITFLSGMKLMCKTSLVIILFAVLLFVTVESKCQPCDIHVEEAQRRVPHIVDQLLVYCASNEEERYFDQCDGIRKVSCVIEYNTTVALLLVTEWCLACYENSTCIDPWQRTFNAPQRILDKNFFGSINDMNQWADKLYGWEQKWKILDSMIDSYCHPNVSLAGCKEWYFCYKKETMQNVLYSRSSRERLMKLWSNVAREQAWKFDPWISSSGAFIGNLFNHADYESTVEPSFFRFWFRY